MKQAMSTYCLTDKLVRKNRYRAALLKHCQHRNRRSYKDFYDCQRQKTSDVLAPLESEKAMDAFKKRPWTPLNLECVSRRGLSKVVKVLSGGHLVQSGHPVQRLPRDDRWEKMQSFSMYLY
jgi:hypothetical protein